jgi:hypothetical protein
VRGDLGEKYSYDAVQVITSSRPQKKPPMAPMTPMAFEISKSF